MTVATPSMLWVNTESPVLEHRGFVRLVNRRLGARRMGTIAPPILHTPRAEARGLCLMRVLKSSPEQRARWRRYNQTRAQNKALGIITGGDRHKLTNVDRENRTGICSQCGPVSLRKGGKLKDGRPRFFCSVSAKNCKRNRQRIRRAGRVVTVSGNYRRHKSDRCERCGFMATHPMQLDVHHRDRNHENNEKANLETICANCHRLEHAEQMGWGRP